MAEAGTDGCRRTTAPKGSDELRREQMDDLRQLVMERATRPSELAMMLVALELSELWQAPQELLGERAK
jgi:hypothetical protein